MLIVVLVVMLRVMVWLLVIVLAPVRKFVLFPLRMVWVVSMRIYLVICEMSRARLQLLHGAAARATTLDLVVLASLFLTISSRVILLLRLPLCGWAARKIAATATRLSVLLVVLV